MDRCIGRHVYSGCSDASGKGCADLRTNAVKYVILSQRTEMCAVAPIELQGSPRQRRAEEMAEMVCGRNGPPAPGLQGDDGKGAKGSRVHTLPAIQYSTRIASRNHISSFTCRSSESRLIHEADRGCRSSSTRYIREYVPTGGVGQSARLTTIGHSLKRAVSKRHKRDHIREVSKVHVRCPPSTT